MNRPAGHGSGNKLVPVAVRKVTIGDSTNVDALDNSALSETLKKNPSITPTTAVVSVISLLKFGIVLLCVLVTIVYVCVKVSHDKH